MVEHGYHYISDSMKLLKATPFKFWRAVIIVEVFVVMTWASSPYLLFAILSGAEPMWFLTLLFLASLPLLWIAWKFQSDMFWIVKQRFFEPNRS